MKQPLKHGQTITGSLFSEPMQVETIRQTGSTPDWRLPALAQEYPRFSTDRAVAEENTLEWHEVKKEADYYFAVGAMTGPMQVREDEADYGDQQ